MAGIAGFVPGGALPTIVAAANAQSQPAKASKCTPLGALRRHLYRDLPGDPFGLGTRTEVPFVMQRGDRMTIDDTKARIGN